MKHYFLITFLFVAVVECHGQSNCPKIFFKPPGSNIDSCQADIKRIGHNIFKNKISVEYKNSDKRFFPYDSVWGFQRKNENIVRLINGNEYEIKYFDTIITTYSQRYFKSSRHYFSLTLDSPIFLLNDKNLRLNLDEVAMKKVTGDKRIVRLIR